MKITNNSINHFFLFIRDQYLEFLLLILVATIYSAMQMLLPYFIKNIIDSFYYYKDENLIYLKISGIGLLSTWLISTLMVYLQGKLLINVLPSLKASISGKAIDSVHNKPYDVMSKASPGLIARKISELSTSAEKIAHFLIVNITHILISIVVSLVILFFISRLFIIIFLLWLFLHSLNLMVYLNSGTDIAKEHAESSSILSGKVVDNLINIQNIHTFNSHAFENKYLSAYVNDEKLYSRKLISHLENMKFRQSLLATLFIASTVTLLMYKAYNHQISVGDFSMIIVLFFNLISVVWALTFQLVSIIKEFGNFSSSINTLFSEQRQLKSYPLSNIMISENTLDIRNLCFRYADKPYLFKNLNFRIKRHEKIAIIGSSGSGKTTLINLLLKLYNSYEGKIFLGGHDISTIDEKILRSAIAYVPQEPLLFNRSILENVRYGNPDASDSDVVAACQLANCTEFIDRLEHKYLTVVGERGIHLSGGERQRLAIARAILKNASIIIFDEPTSSLDDANCELIERSIMKLALNKTVIIITHRMSILEICERVLVFNNGALLHDVNAIEFLRKIKLHKKDTLDLDLLLSLDNGCVNV